ncbi:MAG: response regulator transcription factor [Acidimicrobiales bacterium]
MRVEGDVRDPAAAVPPGGEWWEQVWRAGAVSILLVVDNGEWHRDVLTLLEADGYAVRIDDRGDIALDPACPFDLAVVDLRLRGGSAVAVCASLRARAGLPIIVLSAGASEQEVLAAYAAGADQCLRRSAGPHEVRSRIRALLRRTPPTDRVLIDMRDSDGPVTLDPATGMATVGGIEVPLTQPESAILHALLRRPGRVVPRSELLDLRLGSGPPRVLDSLVRQLRIKLEQTDGTRRIVTVRGVGFRFLLAEQDRGRFEA